MSEPLTKEEIRRLAAIRKRRNAALLKIGITLLGAAAIAAWGFLVAR